VTCFYSLTMQLSEQIGEGNKWEGEERLSRSVLRTMDSLLYTSALYTGLDARTYRSVAAVTRAAAALAAREKSN